jgi:hypothetical protein
VHTKTSLFFTGLDTILQLSSQKSDPGILNSSSKINLAAPETWHWPLEKKLSRQNYYFSGGRGKSDREAYEAARTAWEELKVALGQQAAAAKPHKADYEAAISSWQTVLSWAQNYDQPAIAEKATAKIAELVTRLSRPSPPAVSPHDDQSISRIGTRMASLEFPPLDVDRVPSGMAYRVAEELNAPEEMLANLPGIQRVLDDLVGERIWNSRIKLEIDKTGSIPDEFSAKVWIDEFVNKRRPNVSAGGSANLNRHLLQYFAD